MTPARGRSGRGGGIGRWLTAAVGLGALAAVGFAVGLLAGVAWEEPGLLMSHMLGATEEVAWGPERSSPPGERPRSGSAPSPAVAARPPLGADYAVQVGAFAESGAAERLAVSLREKGFAAYVTPGTDAPDTRWRVRVGPLGSREEAERAAARLKKAERLPTWVLSEDGD
ncbi:MAG: SPOR domain-containing protein [Myxococcota bacterium]